MGPQRRAATADAECTAFLRWALPHMRLRWEGFRKVRRQVCRRSGRRAAELGLRDLGAYRAYLERHAEEWPRLERLTGITISRFHRDRGVFDLLGEEVLPRLAEDAKRASRSWIEAWSAGCASGEEPYTLIMVWRLRVGHRFPGLDLHVLATDIDQAVLDRARRACYRRSSLKELPAEWLAAAFVRRGELQCLRADYRRGVVVAEHDIRTGAPDGPFDLVLCRNLAFTYFEPELQREVCEQLVDVVRPGGVLVVGSHEAVPAQGGFRSWRGGKGIYVR